VTPEERDEFLSLPEGEGVVVLSPDGKVMSANLPAERLLRRRLEPGGFLKPDLVFAPDHLGRAESAVRQALQTGTSQSNLQADLMTGDPDYRPAVEYGVFPVRGGGERIVGVMLTFSRRDAAGSSQPRRIHPGEEIDYDRVFHHLAEGLFTVNARMRITSFNRRAQELTGYTVREVMGRFCWEIFQSDLCEGGCPLRKSMETHQAEVDQDVRIVSKGGERLSILVNTSVIKNQRDEVVGAVESFRPLSAARRPRREPAPPNRRETIIGRHPRLTEITDLLPDLAQTEVSVVIEGESGTGKELIARDIHHLSPRAEGPFVPVNTSALAETLLESELFGHEKGAFTGASTSRAGRFELARAGTLFLDEIAEIKPAIQVKLLRVLEERQFERVGGARPITMDCRIICATNRNLVEEVKKGRFRADLFYRLRTVPLTLPPLRDRLDDLPLLVDHFVDEFNRKYNKRVRGVDLKVLSIFRRYHWPGNVRELQRILEYAFVFIKGPLITPAHLPALEEPPRTRPVAESVGALDTSEERQAIVNALGRAGGRRQEAAKLLGISRSSLWRKMKAYGL
jgi:PAS domain S-box-containing protein